MPCFGTTDRTYQNAVSLIKELGATLKEVRIEKAVRQHFADIWHDENNHDVTYDRHYMLPSQALILTCLQFR